MPVEVVAFRDRLWVVTREDRSGWLYLKSMRRIDEADFSTAEVRPARRTDVNTVGYHPLFKAASTVEPGDYVVVATHLGPGAPTHIVGRVESVGGGRERVSYWRADGAERQSKAVWAGTVWMLVYADPVVGEAHFERDAARFTPRAAEWWKDGSPFIYDMGLAYLQKRLNREAPTVRQLSLGDLQPRTAGKKR